MYTDLNEVFNLVMDLVIRPISSPPPPPFYQWYVIIRVLFIAISLLFLIYIVYFISKTSWLRFRFLENTVEFFTYKYLGARKIVKQWKKIRHRLEADSEVESKLAIMEADSILNNALRKMGFSGETFEERIKQLTPDLLPNIEQVLEAHKTYNHIVYDPDYRLNPEEAKKIILVYEQALVDLQIL